MFLLGILALFASVLLFGLRVLDEYERGVVFRLGRLIGLKGPGLVWIIPFGIDRMVKIPLRTVAHDIPPQDVITKDNVSITVNAVVYYKVADPRRAVLDIEDYAYATSQLAQTTLRSIVGQFELDELLANRDQVNAQLLKVIDTGTDSWGIDIAAVEVKDIDLPQEMKRAMARQAEAERERRAKVIAAEGEFQAAQKLSEAASVIGREPAALQLRYMQTLSEIAVENNSTVVFPIPIDMLTSFLNGRK